MAVQSFFSCPRDSRWRDNTGLLVKGSSDALSQNVQSWGYLKDTEAYLQQRSSGWESLQYKLANLALHRLAGWPLQDPAPCMLSALFVDSWIP